MHAVDIDTGTAARERHEALVVVRFPVAPAHRVVVIVTTFVTFTCIEHIQLHNYCELYFLDINMLECYIPRFHSLSLSSQSLLGNRAPAVQVLLSTSKFQLNIYLGNKNIKSEML